MKLHNFTIIQKALFMNGVLLVSLLGYLFYLNTAINRVKVNGEIYQEIAQGKNLIADVLPPPEYIIESQLTVYQILDAAQHDEQIELQIRIAKLTTLAKAYESRHQYWMHSLPPGKLRTLLLFDSYQPATLYYQELFERFIPLLERGDISSAEYLLKTRIIPLYREHRRLINQVVSVANQENAAREKRAETIITQSKFALLGIWLLILLGLFWSMNRVLVRPVIKGFKRISEIMSEIGKGNYNNTIAVGRHDEIGLVLSSVEQMQTRLCELVSHLEENAATMQYQSEQFRRILELSPIAVAITDLSGNAIRFTNRQFSELFQMTPDQSNGCNMGDIVPLTPAQQNKINLVGNTHNSLLNEVIAIYVNGNQPKWLTLSVFVIDNNNEPARLSWFYDISEIKMAQIELEQEKRTLQNYLDVAGVMLLVLNPDRTVASINKMGCHILEGDESEISGQDWFENFLPEDDRASMLSLFNDILQGDTPPPNDFEHAVLTCKGNKRLIAWHTALLRDDAGVIQGLLNSGEDISERRQAEIALQNHRQQLDTTLNTVMDGVISANANGTILTFNHAAEKIFGYQALELVGKNLAVLMPSPHREQHDQYMHNYLVTRQPHVIGVRREMTGIDRQGRHFPMELTIAEMELDGEIAFTGVVRDITERKKVEDALQVSMGKFREYFDQPLTGMATLTPDMHWLEVNQRLADMLGYPREELVKLNWSDLIHPDDKDDMVHLLQDTLQGTTAGESDQRMIRKDGQILWTSQVIRSVRRTDDSVLYLIALINDISERKLIEQQLRTASKLANAASQSKSDFLANMSHEIRTPMNGIIGLTHLALRTQLTMQQQDYLNKIMHSAQSLLTIINDILDFSKIEAGKLELEAINFDLDQTFSNIINLVGQHAAEKGLELVIRHATTVPNELIGDPLRLGQILLNLTSNAVKFTERGNIMIGVAPAETHISGVPAWRFYVTDTGIGMTPKQLENLFEAFTQADTTTTRQYGGTGLGLVICKRLVEKMGGSISVESAPGLGSTFFFTIPLPVSTLSKPPLRLSNEYISSIRALVADDNPVALQAIVEMLHAFGIEATGVSDGYAAVEEAQRSNQAGQAYNLVLADWKMPGMDGFELIEQLRLKYPDRSMSFIMVTGHDQSEIMNRLPEARPEGFIQKPITPSILLNTIMNALNPTSPSVSSLNSNALPQLSPTLQHLKILLVEDNLINQQIATELVTSMGADVTVASSGHEALTQLSQQEFDLVLMDIQMPGMDGYQTTRAIRENQHLLHLPVIAMTAHALSGDREKSLAAGMNDHIAKPINPEELFTVISRWIKPNNVIQAPPTTPAPTDITLLAAALPCLDLHDALTRLAGNSQLLLHLLGVFIAENTHTFSDIKNALISGDQVQAQALVHRLKGTAGNLGLTRVYKAALTLEADMKQDHPLDLDHQSLQELDTALTLALSELRNNGITASAQT
ncbi:PAS domain S-box protein [Sulfuriferula nivalis]|uniref:Sensor protein FixL n=1 Tax=Sulfuriferula nivalis TaxID=2675298 RepID=A0A809RRF1_9PROT|nr:PAS domain S-box protein [Sulfuriferula nivalis]BBP01451.1 hypothetical protein SFSGTM_21590 [Sulfuriferula nivalis]